MEKKFTSDEVPLGQLLNQAASGDLQLPDFQRGWVWDDSHIVGLLSSISLSYPIGAVMTLQTGNADVRFRPRPLEGVQLTSAREPELLLLDGQQRLTSLFLSLKSLEPVPTRDTRGKDLKRLYYANIRSCINSNIDREDGGIVSVPAEKVTYTDFGREIIQDLREQRDEIREEMFPLNIVLDASLTTDWQMEYLQNGPGEFSERIETWKQFARLIVTPFLQYQVPTIQLAKSTPKEAVCQVFEKVNTGGVSLTVFELLTATFAADDFNLREDWRTRSGTLWSNDVLGRLESTDFLQVVALLSTYERRAEHLRASPDDDKVPPISCKRRDVLRMSLGDYQRWADPAGRALERIVPFLHRECIFRSQDVPYPTQLVPLAAILALVGEKADLPSNRQRLRQWFWCGVFGEMYGGATESRFALDVQDCVAWLDGGPEPRTVKDAQFQAERVLTLRTRQSAAYKGLYALQMNRGGQDFRTGNTTDIHAYFDNGIDISHIFPQRWCEAKGIDRGIADCIVNKTAIDIQTNRKIGGSAPSEYLRRLESAGGLGTHDFDAILRSHDIDPIALRQDDFKEFFNQRLEALLRQISEAMGKPVNRNVDRSESPFRDVGRDAEVAEARIRSLLEAGESRTVEFKSTGRKNLRTGEKDQAMEWAIVKTIAAFMNSHGGTLLVGVDDTGGRIGIELDFPHVGGDLDGWELWLTALIGQSLGKVAATDVRVRFGSIDGATIACIDVSPGARPVFAVPSKGERREVFYARVNNSTQELAGQAALDYQKKRWPS